MSANLPADLAWRTRTLAEASDTAAAAIVHVSEDGRLMVACSCGEDVTHPSGRARYTLQRLTGHMELHATAAQHDVPWTEVRARLDRMARAPRPLRDDDPGE